MKHIVFISWWWPYPANNGSKIRIYNLLRHLSQRYQVTLLSFAEADEAKPDDVAHMRSFCARVEVVPKPIYNPGALKAVLGYVSRWPRSLVDVYSPLMEAKLREVCESGNVDVVVASQFQTLRYLEIVPNIPAVMEEAEITIFQDRVAQSSGRASRLRSQLTLTKLENAFKALLAREVAFTVVSEKEQTYIRQFAPPGARIEVIPNGVDTAGNTPNAAIQPQPYSLIYNGAVTYNANYDAVEYFVHEVWPLVRQRFPQATFTITGGTGSVDVSQLAAQPGVRFSGYLPAIAPAVQSSWAMVAPLRIGGGTRLKILEAMALGVPIVSTTKGAEGLNVHPGADILIADTPDMLADNIGKLFEDTRLRARLAAAGRKLVEHEYDWGVIAARLIHLVEDITQKRNS